MAFIGNNSKTNIGTLERYLYTECRTVILHTIGTDYMKFAGRYGYNVEALRNFMKYTQIDYVNSIKQTGKPYRYLTAVNCVRILENAGYKIELSLKLADNED